MIPAGIIRLSRGSYGHHGHFSHSSSQRSGLSVTAQPEKELNTMSAKSTLATLVALLTAVFVHGAAFAQSNRDLNIASGHRSNRAINKLMARIPSNAFGSIDDRAGTLSGRPTDNIVYNGQVVGRDPDRNVRSQILRDN
jgi:hypothetical protein